MNNVRMFSTGLSLVAALAACGSDEALPAGDPDAAAGTPDAVALDAAPIGGLALYDYAIAVDVTPDGTVALFEDFSTGMATLARHDTVTGAAQPSILLGDPGRTLATGISDDGRISAYHGEPVEAAVWDPTAEWVQLASPFGAGCDQDLGSGFDVSADGHVVVGLMWNGCTPQAFRWSDADGSGDVTLLDVLGSVALVGPGAPVNRATVISDDGAVAGGFAATATLDRTPARWLADGSGELLDAAETATPGEVSSISADGAVLAGVKGDDGFRWTAADGLVPLPRLAGSEAADRTFPNAMSADGTLIFGGVGDSFLSINPTAFVYSEADGMRALADVATLAGVDLGGEVLTSVLGVSADGTVIIGTSHDAAFANHTYVLRLPATAL